MALSEAKAIAPDYGWDIKRINERISEDNAYYSSRLDRVEKKIKILVAVLLEKELIGEAMRRAIEETEVKDSKGNSFKLDKKTLEWLLTE